MIGKLLLLGCITIAFAPIWRDAGWQGGVSAYEAVWNVATKPQKEHISVENAIYLARKAWVESQGG